LKISVNIVQCSCDVFCLMPTVPNIIQAGFFIERTQAGFTSMLLASVYTSGTEQMVTTGVSLSMTFFI
jgi:hypothetical protein